MSGRRSVAGMDIRIAFSDKRGGMLGLNDEFVYERALLVLAEAAGRLGIRIDHAAIAPTRHQAGRDVLVPTAEYRDVVRLIFADPRETLGIELARALPIEASGLWGFLLRSSPTFGDMLRRAARYLRVIYRYTHMRLVEDDDAVSVVCEHPEPSPFGRPEQEVCFFLGQWLTWGRSLIGDRVGAAAVRMRWRGPADRAPLEAFFGCPIQFGAADNALVFSRAVFALTLPEHTPELTEMFDAYAAAIIRRMTPEAGFVDQVREALSEGLLSDGATETAVARRLGVTVRTLHRRLAETETSFRQMRSGLLRARAEQLLRDGELPIAEISYLLGYAEPSTFHRAFRRWTGFAPAEWRNQMVS